MELSKKFLKRLIFILGLVVLTAPVAFGAVTVAQGIQSVAASGDEAETGGEENVPLGSEDEDGEIGETTTDPTITLKKTMKNTKGYKPSASDVFTVNFEQLDNLGKYWGQSGDLADKVFAEQSAQVTLAPASITGSQAKEDVSADTKTATATYNLKDKITVPGYYTFKITEGTINAVSDDNGSRSWANTGTQAYIMTVYLDDENNYTVKIKPENDLSATKSTEANFTNTLTATQNIKVSKVLTGDGLLQADKDKAYSIKVTINGLTSEVSTADGTVTFKDGQASTLSLKGGQDATIKAVPVGATVTISEAGLTGFVASATRDGGTAVTGTLSNGVTLSNQSITMGTGEKNSFTVTNNRDKIVDTGVKVVTNPFVIMLVVALAGVAGYVVLKRKLSKKL